MFTHFIRCKKYTSTTECSILMIHADVQHAVRILARHRGVLRLPGMGGTVFHSKRGSRGETVTHISECVWGATYGLLRSLMAQASPKSKMLEELTALLKDHFEPKPNTIAEHFRFHRRSQHQGGSVVEYMAELRRLASRCVCGKYLKEALRDRIVCGLRSELTQRKLLGDEALTLERAVEVAVSMESAQKHAQALKGSWGLAVSKVDRHYRRINPPENGKTCYHCRKSEHQAIEYPFCDASCLKYGYKGPP